MPSRLRVLIIEDNPDDAELMVLFLKEEGFQLEWRRVDTEAAYRAALEPDLDIILSDWNLPGFSGMRALHLLREHHLDIPFVIVSGNIGEEAAVYALRRGAYDYVLKGHLNRLGNATRNALEEKQLRIQRQEAESALRAKTEELDRYFTSSLDLLCIADIDGYFRRLNPEWETMLGYPLNELERMCFLDLVHPDDMEATLGMLARLASQEEVRQFENRYRCHDGSYRQLEWRAHPQERIIYAVARDITERVQYEERLRLQATALEAVANAIVVTNRNGVIEWANQAFTTLTGYTVEECLGRNPGELLHSGIHDKAFYQNLWQTILAGKVWRGEIINRRKNGLFYTEELTITPVSDAHGKITHFVAIKQDITARKQHERELEAVATISAALRPASTRAEMLPIILDQLMSLLTVEAAAIETLDSTNERLHIELGRGLWQEQTNVSTPADQGLSALILSNGEPYLSNDARDDPRLYNHEAFNACQAAAGVLLTAQGQTNGLLWIGSQRVLNDYDLHLLMVIGDIAANALHRATLHEQTERRLRQLTALRMVDQAIAGSLDLWLTLNVIAEQTIAQLKVDAAAVLLYNPHLLTLEYAVGRGFRTRDVERARARLGEGQAGRAALERRTLTYPDLRTAKDAFSRRLMMQREDFASHHVTPLIVKGQVRGVLEVFHRTPLEPDLEWVEYFETLAQQTAIAIDNAQLFDGLQRSNAELSLAYDATIEGWSRALDLRDKETEGHTLRVTALTERLARAMGVSDVELANIRRGALLHDMGKLGVPDAILLKPGPLTEEEWIIMRKHPQLAYDMLSPIAYLRPAMDIPYCHHEKWDGTGYPRGLKGEEIPLAARLFAVVDVWDALRHDRPYRAAWPKAKVLQHIHSLSGTHFDPKVVELFFRVMGDAD